MTASDVPQAGIDRRHQIVTESARLFANAGFGSVSMGDLARAVGLSKPTLYHYFSSKEEILSSVLDDGVATLLAEALCALDAARTPEERLRLLFRTHMNNFQEKMFHVAVFLREGNLLMSTSGLERYVELRREYDHLWIEVICEGQASGVFSEGDPTVIAFGILGMLNWMVQWYSPDGRVSVDEITQEYEPMVLRAVGVV
jgi:TetR/AcrR family transcriptional regulator, cholesterol catabolism regulator